MQFTETRCNRAFRGFLLFTVWGVLTIFAAKEYKTKQNAAISDEFCVPAISVSAANTLWGLFFLHRFWRFDDYDARGYVFEFFVINKLIRGMAFIVWLISWYTLSWVSLRPSLLLENKSICFFILQLQQIIICGAGIYLLWFYITLTRNDPVLVPAEMRRGERRDGEEDEEDGEEDEEKERENEEETPSERVQLVVAA